jgi:DNA helicase HerA-like ATPase
MKIKLGITKFKNYKTGQQEEVILDTERVINGHMTIIGASGTGKTYNIRKIINVLNEKKSQFHILDVHGDIEIDGASSVKFSETTDYGLSPLTISPDEDFGGVRKKIRSFISMINRTSRQLGSKQESVLINILNDLFAANGFYANDKRTWSLNYDPYKYRKFKKRYPNVSDLKKFTEYKLRQMVSGGSSKAIQKLEDLNKKITNLNKYNNKVNSYDEEKIEKLKLQCKELYTDYIDSIETGTEIEEMIKYDSREVIKSVYERITNLESAGIFKSTPPPFDKTKSIYRYDIKSLNKDEQKMFVDVLCEDIFLQAKQRGEVDSADIYIVIDEAHIFLNNDSNHIINVIAKEARKFGIGLILASQSFTHFPEDIVANTATKIILGIDEMYHQGSAKKLMIDPKQFSYIIPRKSAMIQIKNAGDMSNKFIDVML